EVSETIVRVEVLDRESGQRLTLDRIACGFAYRDSVFKREAKGRYVVVAVTFELRRGEPSPPRYLELARLLESTGDRHASLVTLREAVLSLRRKKSMVIEPTDVNRRSVGSFFTNPILDADAVELVRDRARTLGTLGEGEAMPEFPADGKVKLSAAWL